HTIFLVSNYKPHAPADDYAFWERVIAVPHNLSFVDCPDKPHERKKDPYLSEKLMNEAPGILAWLVRGCLNWQKQGLNPPKAVKQETAEYQKSEDNINAFEEHCCYIGDNAEVGATALYQKFKEWWELHISDRPPKQKKFGTIMKKRHERVMRGGYAFYIGIGLLDNHDRVED
ncbi:MAG: DNA primase, partial [Desulfobacteraceae bacterium]|nr:DNA primase [Desulfobacteraceae bacterium]